jgi:hypothetical protein
MIGRRTEHKIGWNREHVIALPPTDPPLALAEKKHPR